MSRLLSECSRCCSSNGSETGSQDVSLTDTKPIYPQLTATKSCHVDLMPDKVMAKVAFHQSLYTASVA